MGAVYLIVLCDHPYLTLRESPACTKSMEVPYCNFEVHLLWPPHRCSKSCQCIVILR